MPQTVEQKRLLLEVGGIADQIAKSHFLNVHFRAFRLADDAWKEHIRQNARLGARESGSPPGAVLGDEEETPDVPVR